MFVSVSPKVINARIAVVPPAAALAAAVYTTRRSNTGLSSHRSSAGNRAIVISGPRASVRVDTEASTHVDTRRDERKCLGARDFGVISPHGLGLGVNAR